MKFSFSTLFILICIVLYSSLTSLHAQTFEQTIDQLPPEKEDDILSRVSDAIDFTNILTKDITDLLRSGNDLDVEKFFASVNRIKDTFVKKQLEHRRKLEKERNDALAAFNDIIHNASAPDSAKASAAIRLADAYFAINEIPAAEKPIREALQLKTITSSAPDKRLTLYSYLLDCYLNSGRTDRAKRLLKTMEKEYSSDPKSYSYGRYLRCLANFNLQQAHFRAALARYRQSNEILSKFPDNPAASATTTANDWQIGLLRIMTRECTPEEGTAALLDMTKSMMTRGDTDGNEIAVLGQKAYQTLWIAGNMKEAFDMADKTLKLTQQLYPAGSELELSILYDLGEMINDNNTLPSKFQTANRFTRKGAHHYLYGCKMIAEKIWDKKHNGNNQLLHNINKSLAKAYARKSDEEFRKLGKLEKKGKFHAKRARMLYDEELKALRDDLHERFLALNDNERTAYTSRMTDFCNDILIFAEAHRNDSQTRELVYDVCLLRKSLLLDLSRSLSTIVKETGNAQLLDKNSELTALRDAITRADQSNEPIETIDDLEAKADALEDEIILGIGELTSYDPAAFVRTTWKDVRQSLPANSLAIEFYNVPVAREDGSTFLVDRMVMINRDRNPEIIPIQMTRTAIENLKGKPFDQIARRSFYANVWEPLVRKKIISPDKRITIYFSPNGLYHSIPLEYLPCDGQRTMADAYNMVRVSSTRLLPHNQHGDLSTAALYGDMDFAMGSEDRGIAIGESATRGQSDASGVFKPLPYTKDEVEAIYNLISPNGAAALSTGRDCLEENFKNLSGGDNRLIHIATHGYVNIDPSRPDATDPKKTMNFTGLAFNGAASIDDEVDSGIEDGRLTAAEIALMDLSNTDMVVLSACSTGKGQITDEGVFGLQRGFKLAGVNTVVMSLWDMDDKATMDLMTAFYKALSEGETKRKALTKAQEYVKSRTYTVNGKSVSGTDPRLWSGFIILD